MVGKKIRCYNAKICTHGYVHSDSEMNLEHQPLSLAKKRLRLYSSVYCDWSHSSSNPPSIDFNPFPLPTNLASPSELFSGLFTTDAPYINDHVPYIRKKHKPWSIIFTEITKKKKSSLLKTCIQIFLFTSGSSLILHQVSPQKNVAYKFQKPGPRHKINWHTLISSLTILFHQCFHLET